MTDKIYRAEVILNAKSGLVKDAVVNNFILRDTAGTMDAGPLVATQGLAKFYNDQPAGQPFDLATYIATWASRVTNDVRVKYYDITGHLDGSPTGSPVWQDAFTLDPEDTGGPNQFPSEIAACLTLRGTGWDTSLIDIPAGAPGPAGDVRPRQRHSGRLYLGPLNTDATNIDGTTGKVTVGSTFRAVALHAAKATLDYLAASNIKWSCWSRVGGVVLDVVKFQMDDAWDVQRRRGVAPTVRDQYP